MIKQLRHDSETGELRLVYRDLWQGNHEVTEYRVMSDRTGGRPIRNRADLDGREVLGTAPDLYITNRVPGALAQVPVWTEQTAIGPTVKVPCPRAGNARKRCALCG